MAESSNEFQLIIPAMWAPGLEPWGELFEWYSARLEDREQAEASEVGVDEESLAGSLPQESVVAESSMGEHIVEESLERLSLRLTSSEDASDRVGEDVGAMDTQPSPQQGGVESMPTEEQAVSGSGDIEVGQGSSQASTPESQSASASEPDVAGVLVHVHGKLSLLYAIVTDRFLPGALLVAHGLVRIRPPYKHIEASAFKRVLIQPDAIEPMDQPLDSSVAEASYGRMKALLPFSWVDCKNHQFALVGLLCCQHLRKNDKKRLLVHMREYTRMESLPTAGAEFGYWCGLFLAALVPDILLPSIRYPGSKLCVAISSLDRYRAWYTQHATNGLQGIGSTREKKLLAGFELLARESALHLGTLGDTPATIAPRANPLLGEFLVIWDSVSRIQNLGIREYASGPVDNAVRDHCHTATRALSKAIRDASVPNAHTPVQKSLLLLILCSYAQSIVQLARASSVALSTLDEHGMGSIVKATCGLWKSLSSERGDESTVLSLVSAILPHQLAKSFLLVEAYTAEVEDQGPSTDRDAFFARVEQVLGLVSGLAISLDAEVMKIKQIIELLVTKARPRPHNGGWHLPD